MRKMQQLDNDGTRFEEDQELSDDEGNLVSQFDEVWVHTNEIERKQKNHESFGKISLKGTTHWHIYW